MAALPVVALAQAAPSLDDVVRGLEGAYGKMNDLKAEFSQTAFNKSLNQSIPAQGTVYLKKGGKLRWEYSIRRPQEIVSDGKTALGLHADAEPGERGTRRPRRCPARPARSWPGWGGCGSTSACGS